MWILSNREKVRFLSQETECVAWHYPRTNGGCVVMAGGFAVPKEPGTDLFAERLNEAGFSVLSFDYRRLGESGGQPRQVVRLRDQLADWQAAIRFASMLPRSTRTASRSGPSPRPAARSSKWLLVTANSRQRSHRTRLPMAWLRCAAR